MINCLFYNYLFKKLKLTWKKLSKKSLINIQQLHNFCSGYQNYIKIRKEVSRCKKIPYVPYLGTLLKEIMGIEEMRYNINNNINILKLLKLDSTINHFFEFTKFRYPFKKSKHLEILSAVNPRKEEEIESIIAKLEPKLMIHANKGDKKRITKTDKEYYMK